MAKMLGNWVIVAGLAVGQTLAGQGVGWRTDGTGRYPDAKPALEWAVDKNVLWMAPTPNWSNASPVICGDRIFVTAEPDTLMCISKTNGKVLWQKSSAYEQFLTPEEMEKVKQAERISSELKSLAGNDRGARAQRGGREGRGPGQRQSGGEGRTRGPQSRAADQERKVSELHKQLEPLAKYIKPAAQPTNGYASSTPVTDGDRVYVVFGTAVAACYDLQGDRKWIHMVDRPANQDWGYSASPLLADGKLIIHMNDLVALNTADGKELWRTKAAASFGTSAVTRIGDADVIITPQGDFVLASDGTNLAGVPAGLEYNTPIVQDGTVYFVATANGAALAVKLPEKAEKFTPQVLWKAECPKDRHYASTVFHQGRLYAVTRSGQFSIIDAKDGKVIEPRRLGSLGGNAFSSVTLAGGHLFVGSDTGKMLVLNPEENCKEVATNVVDSFRSSPVFEGGRMYLRTLKGLYCIGK